MSKHLYRPTRPFKTKAFGFVSEVTLASSVEMIDTTAMGASFKTATRGRQSLSLDVTIESDSDAWSRRIGETLDVDEIFGNESSAFRLVGPMIVWQFVWQYEVSGLHAGILTAIISLKSAGPFSIQESDPTVLVMRQRIDEVRAAAGLT